MAWTTPDFAFLKLRMGVDFAALQKQAKAQAQEFTDIVAAVISDQVGLVRGYVAGNPSNVLGEEGSIPAEAVAPFVALARLALIATIPGGVALGDDLRQSQEKRALETLTAIAKGAVRITPATDTSTAQPEDAGGLSASPDGPLSWGDEEISNT